MTRNRLVPLAILVAGILVAASIALSLHLARRQALADEFERVQSYARDVRSRAEATGDEVSQAFDKLAPLRDAAVPCSADELALLRGIDIGSATLQAIGRVDHGLMVCSSYGIHPTPLPLGPVDYVSPTNVAFRLDVRLPFALDKSFLVLERDGFVAIVHKDDPIDSTIGVEDAVLAVVARREGRVLTGRGAVERGWLERNGAVRDEVFVDTGHVVAISRSGTYNIVAVAALPLAHYQAAANELAKILLPFGAAAGVLLALVVYAVAKRQLAWPAQIRSGLRRNEFTALYQPIVDLESRRWVGAEVLLRWPRAGSPVGPDVFIPAAEEAGLIHDVTRRVLELVEPALTRLATTGAPFHLSINLAAADLHSPDTPGLLEDLLQRTGASPSRLRVEVTERGFARTESAAQVVDALRARGIRVAIDDFGTGYSSLSYLEAFELDTLKIDKSFVDTLGADASAHVASHIIGLARSLALEMVAEGIEREDQVTVLLARGVHHGQGWLFAKPLRLDDLFAALARQREVEAVEEAVT